MAWFHGGVRGLDVGDTISPAAETGQDGAYARQYAIHRLYRETDFARAYRRDRVYLTRSVDAATVYAAMISGCSNVRHREPGCDCPPDAWSRFAGDVYEVEPIGHVERDADGKRGFGRARAARIVGVVGWGAERYWLDYPYVEGALWFHGGVPGLDVGDMLLPSSVTGLNNGIDEADSELVAGLVFFSQRRETARFFARHHPFGTEARGGDLYRVEPVGPVRPDPMLNRLDGIAACADSARVVEVIRRAVLRQGQIRREWLEWANGVRIGLGMPALAAT